MTDIRVDFNETNALGQVKGHQRWATGPLVVGQAVRVADRYEAGMAFAGVVVSVTEGGRILLEIHEERPAQPSDVESERAADRSRRA